MKTVNVVFEDAEWNALNRAKGEKENWHDFILRLLQNAGAASPGKSALNRRTGSKAPPLE